jgi:tRNA(adenine34) deaminase
MHGNYGGFSYMPELTTSSDQNIYTIRLPEEYGDEMIHDYFMDLALEQAQLAREKGEVPIGAVIVGRYDDDANSTNWYTTPSRTDQYGDQRTFRVLSRAHNLVETNVDASAHAELLALRQGARNLQNWRYPPNSTLYTTLEPCPMCLSSIQAFRIDNLVYGAPDHRLGAIETHMNLLSIVKHPYHAIKFVVGGVREKRCADIVVDFFRERRKNKKEAKCRTLHEEGLLRKEDDPLK